MINVLSDKKKQYFIINKLDSVDKNKRFVLHSDAST